MRADANNWSHKWISSVDRRDNGQLSDSCVRTNCSGIPKPTVAGFSTHSQRSNDGGRTGPVCLTVGGAMLLEEHGTKQTQEQREHSLLAI